MREIILNHTSFSCKIYQQKLFWLFLIYSGSFISVAWKEPDVKKSRVTEKFTPVVHTTPVDRICTNFLKLFVRCIIRTVRTYCMQYRGYLLFLGEYQICFIECDENISKFTSA